MKNRATQGCVWLLAAIALLVPQDVAAICLKGMMSAAPAFEEEGTSNWGGDFRFGPDDWVVGANYSYAPSDAFRIMGGPGFCRFFDVWSLALAFRADAQVWMSDDERASLSVGPALNWFDRNGLATTVFMGNGTVQYVLFDNVKAYGGVSVSAARASGGVVSSTDSYVGAFGGLMLRTEDDLCIVAGLNYQRFELDPQVSLDLGVTLPF